MSNFDVILHPTDFSVESDQAFQLACNMARDQFASLVVVHVLPRPSCSSCDCSSCDCSSCESEVDITDDQNQVIRNCREQFSLMKSKAAEIPLTFRIVFGNAVASILKVAHEEKAELIVVASHRHTQFHLQVHGSVAEGVLRQTHCPVVVLRQPSQTYRSQFASGCSAPNTVAPCSSSAQ